MCRLGFDVSRPCFVKDKSINRESQYESDTFNGTSVVEEPQDTINTKRRLPETGMLQMQHQIGYKYVEARVRAREEQEEVNIEESSQVRQLVQTRGYPMQRCYKGDIRSGTHILQRTAPSARLDGSEEQPAQKRRRETDTTPTAEPDDKIVGRSLTELLEYMHTTQ